LGLCVLPCSHSLAAAADVLNTHPHHLLATSLKASVLIICKIVCTTVDSQTSTMFQRLIANYLQKDIKEIGVINNESVMSDE